MLDDHISHQLSVGVSLLIEAMNLVHMNMVKLNLPVVSSSKNCSVCWVDRSCPDPVFHFANSTKKNTLSVPEGDLSVAARHDHVVTFWEEGDRAWIEAKVFLIANRFSLLSSLYGVK